MSRLGIAGLLLLFCGACFADDAPLTRIGDPVAIAPRTKAAIQVTLQPNSYSSYFVDLPSNVATLTVTTAAPSGEVDLFVKPGVPHRGTSLGTLQTESAYFAQTAGPNERVTASRSSSPALKPGRWWFTPVNTSAAAVTLTLDVGFTTAGAAFQMTPGMSGAWYDPAKNFQGFFFQILDSSTALATWFTYDPNGNQAYMIGVGTISGDKVTITNLVKTRGARFGNAFDASQVVREDWGDLVFTFDGCTSGYASFLPESGSAQQGWPAEQLNLTRLTTVQGLGCPQGRETKYLRGGISGAWYDSERSGEGWLIEVLNDTTAFIYWFSYTPTGEQAWFGNIGTIVDGSIIIGNALQPTGGRFGPDYNAATVTLRPWGAYALTFTGCRSAVVTSVGPNGYGTFNDANIERLTTLASTDPCGFSVGTVTVSGTVRASSNTFIDGDVNDPNTPNIDNDSPAQTQAVTSPAVIMGYATAVATGKQGDRFATTTDAFDAYTLPMAQGQVIKLAIADHDGTASAPDLDLFLYATGSSANPVASSRGTGPLEQIVVPASGQYDIVVNAFAGSSSYVLSVDNAGTAAASVAGAMSEFDEMSLDDVVVEFREKGGADEPANRRDAKSAAEGLGLSLGAGALGRPVRLMLGDAARRAAAAKRIGPKAASRDTWRVDDPKLRARGEVIDYVKTLRARSDIASAEPNFTLRPAAVPNDTFYPLQWNYPLINLPQAWDMTTGSNNVVVAIIDTGVVPHPDLNANLHYELGYDFVSDPLKSVDGSGIDTSADDPGDGDNPDGSSSFHGTHVAGTVSARGNNGSGVTGVAWNTDLMPVRVLGHNGGSFYDIAQGIRWAAGLPNDSGTTPSRRANVINMSIGALVSCPAEYANLIAAARANGVIVVAAAGNESTSRPSLPAACPGVVSVSAVDLIAQLAPYSNFGPTIDVAAPGGDTSVDRNADGYADGVLSTLADDSNGSRVATFNFYQGTSMASPHVAGVAALMKAAFPALTPDQFDGLLASGAITRDLAGNGPSVRDDQFGYGLIDALKAVTEARRLAGNATVPPAIVATPSTLDFGSTMTLATVAIANAGQGTLTVSSATSTQPWLSVAPASVNAQGVGTYTISVNRNGLVASSYQGQVRFLSSAGTVAIAVGMRVGEQSSATNAGTIYVLLVDTVTGVPAYQAIVNPSSGTYTYSIPNVLPGAYYVLTGSDMDHDFFVCDAGESCGAFTSLSDPSLISTGSTNVSVPVFVVAPDTGLLGTTMPSAKAAASRFVLRAARPPPN